MHVQEGGKWGQELRGGRGKARGSWYNIMKKHGFPGSIEVGFPGSSEVGFPEKSLNEKRKESMLPTYGKIWLSGGVMCMERFRKTSVGQQSHIMI